MADQTPEFTEPQPSRSRREIHEENARLALENAELKQRLAKEVADRGPALGTEVCYQRQGEGYCRPAKIASDGFTEFVKAPGGVPDRHALIEYGEPPWTIASGVPDHMKGHSFQCDRPWSSLGKPETWHLADECPRQGGPGCPYAPHPEWPPRRPSGPSKLDSVEAP